MRSTEADRPELRVDDLVQGDVQLASPPEIYARLRNLIKRPDCTTAVLARAIEHDPALCARLLRLANSAFFALPRPVSDIGEAIRLVGIGELKGLVLTTEVLRRFDAIPADLIDIYRFWQDSLRCAVLAKHLGGRRGRVGGEPIFLCGLLHGIGRLVIYTRIPELARKALLEHHHRGLPLADAERAVIGFDHAAVGESLARQWELPEPLPTVIGHHLAPALAPEYRTQAATVHIALAASRAATFDANEVAAAAPQHPAAWEIAGISRDDLAAVLSEAQASFAGALTLLE